MDRRLWSVKQWLAVLVWGVALAPGSGAKATTSTLPGGRVALIVPADF